MSGLVIPGSSVELPENGDRRFEETDMDSDVSSQVIRSGNWIHGNQLCVKSSIFEKNASRKKVGNYPPVGTFCPNHSFDADSVSFDSEISFVFPEY